MIATITVLRDALFKRWPRSPIIKLDTTTADNSFDLNDAINLRCEIDLLSREIAVLNQILSLQQMELDNLRDIADTADHIWDGRGTRERLATLIQQWRRHYWR